VLSTACIYCISSSVYVMDADGHLTLLEEPQALLSLLYRNGT
jgi:hypothetical protein